ncbi:TetR family transcriptional regulator [Phyllobacterium phragmitis]|uniref:TetR family transcriptional regulator n=1 Tax=Phyllobacterium phragmitis TaxID=2670329 RepID=A0A2S9IXE2_9HYPH|nr:TetR/AcrR family transcriptional regulator [Phyllobacterium phragmitis]PRD45160.1 TetR family transcriptional regulator [Phyllobacterium phragmitis]
MKRNSILDAAARTFCRDGFTGTSIDLIAAEAGVSRQTIYNHYRDKEMLFGAVVDEIIGRMNAVLYGILATFPEKPDNLEADLVLFATRLGKNCMCNQDGEFLRKLIQAEGERYPELFAIWRENGPARVWSAIAARLARLAHCGALDIDDPDLAARQFMALINTDLQFCGMLGEKPTEKQIEDGARNGVRTFLRAFASRGNPSTKADPAVKPNMALF